MVASGLTCNTVFVQHGNPDAWDSSWISRPELDARNAMKRFSLIPSRSKRTHVSSKVTSHSPQSCS